MSLRDILGLAEGKSKSQHPLWTLLGPAIRPAALSTPSRVTPTIHPISSKDKTATSLRLLLCDAQNTLESFSTQIHGLVKDVGRSNLQLEETTKVLENGQATSTGDLKVLLSRIQTIVVKSLDQTNSSIQQLELNHVKLSSTHESLQQQIITLTQQVALNIEKQKEEAKARMDSENQRDQRMFEVLQLVRQQQDLVASQTKALEDLASHVGKLEGSRACRCASFAGPPPDHAFAAATRNTSTSIQTTASRAPPATPNRGVAQLSPQPELTTARQPPLQISQIVDLRSSSPLAAPPPSASKFSATPRLPSRQHNIPVTPRVSNRPFAPLPRSQSRTPSTHFQMHLRQNIPSTGEYARGPVTPQAHAVGSMAGNPFVQMDDEYGSFGGRDAVDNAVNNWLNDDSELPSKRHKGIGGVRRPVRRMIEQQTLLSPANGENSIAGFNSPSL